MKRLLPAVFTLFIAVSALAEDTTSVQRFNLHFQTTYVYQYKPAFHSPYSGPNSLRPAEEKQNSVTATLYAGARLWKGAEIYLNPEIAGGSGLSGAFGLGAATNGETFRVGDPSPTLYLARGFFQQTIQFGTYKDTASDQPNQLREYNAARYLRFLLGKFSLGDVFDNNGYSGSARTQFMNWSLMNNGAWDYAANVRGYTYGAVGIMQWDNMSYRLGIAAEPLVANGDKLNTDISKAYSLNAEVTRTYFVHRHAGHLRLLAYHNSANMGNYRAAINSGMDSIVLTRKYGRNKTGVGLNADQALSDIIGVFGRIGWNDGQNETWAFTEVDRTVCLGISINGKNWHRSDDVIAFAFVANGLSADHREYLADGGLGFQLGDRKLNYGHETAAELYYSWKPVPYGIWLTGDYQLVVNPGYNKDRGPVNVFSVRVHVEL